MFPIRDDNPHFTTPYATYGLIGNLWFLWIFGNNVEDAMGHVRFVAPSVLFRDREMRARHPHCGWNQKASPTQNWHRVRR